MLFDPVRRGNSKAFVVSGWLEDSDAWETGEREEAGYQGQQSRVCNALANQVDKVVGETPVGPSD